MTESFRNQLGGEKGSFEIGVARVKYGNLKGGFPDVLAIVRSVDDFG